MSESEADTSRTVVQTYVPAYQRDEWDAHAEELGMSRSEFVKSMVQAGRRVFDEEETPSEHGNQADEVRKGETQPPHANGNSLEERVRTALAEADCLSWEELFAAVSNDIEERLDETLTRLQEANEVRHSGRDGGYVLEESESG